MTNAPESAKDQPDERMPLLVFFLALFVRAFHLRQMHGSIVSEHLLGDGARYDEWARQIIGDGGWIGDGVFYQAPLYPYFLAAIYAVIGPSAMTARMVQIFMGSAACALLAGAGRRIFGSAAGTIAGVLLAIYPTAVFFDGLIQKSVLDTLFMCLLLWLLARGNLTRLRALGVGACLGALILSRENAMVLVPVVAAWVLLGDRTAAFKARALLALMLLAGVMLPLAPVLARNKLVGGEFHLTTSQLGSNLYIGNNPQSKGSYVPLRPGRGSPEFERIDATELAEQAVGRPLTPGEVSRYWARQALDFIRTQPGQWLRLMGRKFMLLWNRVELVDTDDQYTYARWSPVLKLGNPVLNFGVLVPLAALGIALTASQWRKLWHLYAMLASLAVSVVAFYVFARYRFPMTPLLILFGAAGIAGVMQMVRDARRWTSGGVIAALSLTLATALVANWRVVDKSEMRAAGEMMVGQLIQRHSENPADALPHFREAVRLMPRSADVHQSLGVALAQQGDMAGAAESFATASALNPQFRQARLNLARALGEIGRTDDAVRQFEQWIAGHPDDALARIWLGDLLAEHQRYAEAREQFTEARKLLPDDTELKARLRAIDAILAPK